MKKLFSVALCLLCVLALCVPAMAESEDYLAGISGTYVELFPELSKDEYHEAWLYMCTADIYGAEATEAYPADPNSMRFDCYYIGGVKKMTMDGDTITGYDESGAEVFSHTYAPVDVENENGFIFYKTDDADAGQFTYFAFSPDTMEETYHLEFRYAEDPADLLSWFEGNYAYWNVGAIAEDYTQEQILGAINLFATENLSEEAE